MTPLYAVGLSGEALSAYKKRLVQEDTFVPPDPKTEPAAYALLNAALEMHVFIYRDPNSRAEAGEREPDLSFEINLQANQFLRSRTASDQKRRKWKSQPNETTAIRMEKYAQTGISNSPDDRYSNGLIISTADLPGSELEIHFCPLVMLPNGTQEKEAELAQKVRLEQVYIAFPGRQEFSIASDDKKNVRSIAAAGLERCSLLYYTFPSRLEEFKKAQVP